MAVCFIRARNCSCHHFQFLLSIAGFFWVSKNQDEGDLLFEHYTTLKVNGFTLESETASLLTATPKIYAPEELSLQLPVKGECSSNVQTCKP
jgi:hypothetical protein